MYQSNSFCRQWSQAKNIRRELQVSKGFTLTNKTKCRLVEQLKPVHCQYESEFKYANIWGNDYGATLIFKVKLSKWPYYEIPIITVVQSIKVTLYMRIFQALFVVSH